MVSIVAIAAASLMGGATGMNMDMSSSTTGMSMSMSMSMDMASSTMKMGSSVTGMSMGTSSMNMGGSHMSMEGSTMNMGSMSMTASPSATGGMPMPMSTSSSSTSSSSMGGMDGMDMDMNMPMNSYLTPKFMNYPVLFQGLYASSKAQAFGIFVLIITACFTYKSILFLSWCLEVKWFKRKNPNGSPGQVAPYGTETDDSSSQLGPGNYMQDLEFQTRYLPKVPNIFVDFASPSSIEVLHDLVRLILTFVSTMIVYMLMLVAMSFVLTYVFAVILGLAWAEVFFNRWKLCLIARWDLQREIKRRMNCNGGASCKCGNHHTADVERAEQNSSVNEKGRLSQETLSRAVVDKTNKASDSEDAGCCCDSNSLNREEEQERQAREISKETEQTGTMDVNLNPPEKFV
ncbi:LAMI_0H04940g1_1 [Lachancea mirantina]|uniref:Copper transport protein n=1 Tax=Lachancea mirantina TaxID=1230905 RepID=A0A1G4KEW1_9SACH|nr:LAMI_0H04940g1_1 [Lachancea mirantina]